MHLEGGLFHFENKNLGRNAHFPITVNIFRVEMIQ